jgi:hypothetical protein
MTKSSSQSLYLTIPERRLSSFYYLLQTGFKLNIVVGKNVEATLTHEFGLDMELLDKIQTVFLDGKAVDDLESSVVKEGSTIALSSAMPGLVGATLRRGSYYAAMRSQITAAKTEEVTSTKEGMITLKLFNLLITQLGPGFLKRGIWLETRLLRDFLTALPQSFWTDCMEALINGRLLEPKSVPFRTWPETDELIFLRVAPGAPGVRACLE